MASAAELSGGALGGEEKQVEGKGDGSAREEEEKRRRLGFWGGFPWLYRREKERIRGGAGRWSSSHACCTSRTEKKTREEEDAGLRGEWASWVASAGLVFIFFF